MSDTVPFSFEVLGEPYVEVTDPDTLLWAGALLYFTEPNERDCRCYMLHYSYQWEKMLLMNWMGYKAGLDYALGDIPKSELHENALAVRRGWFRDNWASFEHLGSYESTKFLVFQRDG